MPPRDDERAVQEPRAGQGAGQSRAEPSLPSPVRAEDRDQGAYAQEMAGRRRGYRGPSDPEREEYERERERDSHLPLVERRPEFLTEDERVEQAEEAHRQYPKGYSPTASLGDG